MTKRRRDYGFYGGQSLIILQPRVSRMVIIKVFKNVGVSEAVPFSGLTLVAPDSFGRVKKTGLTESMSPVSGETGIPYLFFWL